MERPTRTRRHHALLADRYARADAWVEAHRAELRRALAASMSPAERLRIASLTPRVLARRALVFAN